MWWKNKWFRSHDWSVPVNWPLYQRFLHSDFYTLLQKVQYLLHQCHRVVKGKRDLLLEILVKRWSYRQYIPGVVYVRSHLKMKIYHALFIQLTAIPLAEKILKNYKKWTKSKWDSITMSKSIILRIRGKRFLVKMGTKLFSSSEQAAREGEKRISKSERIRILKNYFTKKITRSGKNY